MPKITVTIDTDELSEQIISLRKIADHLEMLIPTELPPKRYKLIIFDMNGTLTNTPFIDKQPLQLLPGRKEHLTALREEYADAGLNPPLFAIASNQGGVAFGFATEIEARDEVAGIAIQIDTTLFEVSFGHPKPKIGYEHYGTDAMLVRRKPAPGMLLALMQRTGITPDDTLMVGDLPEDQKAAKAAGVDFVWARDFFPPAPPVQPESDPFLPDWDLDS